MYRLVLVLVFSLAISGCATSKYSTDIGVSIGNVYQEAAKQGTVSATESIKAWPYVSGQIKGLLASNYSIEMPESVKRIIKDLDRIAKKKPDQLTDYDKGYIIGSFCRLEADAIRFGWDRYGAQVIGVFRRLSGI